MYIGLHVNFPLFLSDYNETWIFSTVVLVFSPWASLGMNQSPIRRPIWLWYAASWASF